MEDIPELFRDYPPHVLERFKAFNQDNPQVWEEFKKMAWQMKKTSRRRYSARTIVEVIRWHHDLQTTGDVFEINNDWAPIYARLLIHNYPHFSGFFELRSIKSLGIGSQEQRRRETEKGQLF